MKFAILIPYFGRWPSYMPLYLEGCRRNSLLDVIFLTDIEPAEGSPDNVRYVHYTVGDVKRKFEEKLGLDNVSIDYPYKLCDLRPAFGYVFADLLKDYDYWGWGDIDLIYGNISNFLQGDLADVLSFRPYWISGGFTLIRNRQPANELFLANDDYRQVFSSSGHFSYGECGKKWQELREKPLSTVSFEISNMTTLVDDHVREQKITSALTDHLKESIKGKDWVMYDEGVITDSSGREFLLYHYIAEKKNGVFRCPNWSSSPSKFYIDNTGFFTESQFAWRFWLRLGRQVERLPSRFWRRLQGLLRRIRRL